MLYLERALGKKLQTPVAPKQRIKVNNSRNLLEATENNVKQPSHSFLGTYHLKNISFIRKS